MRNKLALIVGVVLGLIALYGVAQWMKGVKQTSEQKYRTVRVAAAGKRILAGTVMDPSCLLKEEQKDGKVLLGIEVPETAVTSENIMVSDEDRLIGLTINHTVERGEDLLVSYFRQPIQKLDARLHLGERAITLRVDGITGVASNLTPGSHVDIIGTFPLAAPGGGPMKASGAAASHTVLLLQNVTILATDSRTRDDEFAAGGDTSRTYSSVTVAATPQEANMLVFAQQYGTLTLSLRAPVDGLPPSGENEVTEANVIQDAQQAEKAREERLKNNSPIEATPAP